MTASEADLCALAAIVTAEREDLPAQGLPPSLLSDLMGQIRCDTVQFQGFDSGRQGNWFIQGVPEDNEGEPDLALERAHGQHYWDSLPCSYPDRTGDLRSVVKIADFYSVRQWRSSGMYCDVYRPEGVEHELQLCLPEPPGPSRGPGRTLRLYLFRFSGPDFSERDRALLTLIRPHLHQAYLSTACTSRRAGDLRDEPGFVRPEKILIFTRRSAGHTAGITRTARAAGGRFRPGRPRGPGSPRRGAHRPPRSRPPGL